MSNISIKIGNISTLKISVLFGYFYVLEPIYYYTNRVLHSSVFCWACHGRNSIYCPSTYSKYLPETTDHASYFSFYDVSEKVGIVLGTAFFAFTEWRFDDIRYSVISVALFLLSDFSIYSRCQKEEKIINS